MRVNILDKVLVEFKLFIKSFPLAILAIVKSFEFVYKGIIENIIKLIEFILINASGYLIFAGILMPILILSYQVYIYSRTGTWITFSVIDLLSYLNFQWAKYPTDWLGIWKVFNFLHASIPISIMLIYFGIKFHKD